MRQRIAVIGIAAVLAGALADSALARTSATKLTGTVGPGFTITLKDSKGKTVKKLKAGTYRIVVSDKAAIHDFVLEQEKGGSFEKELTGVSFTGKKTVTVKLTKGTWKYYCAPHASTMHGEFTVT